MGKITNADVQAAVVSVDNTEVQNVKHSKKSDRYYTLLGKQDFYEEGCPMANSDSDYIYAIKRYKGLKAHFFIRSGRNGMFYNPMDSGTAGRQERELHNINSGNNYVEVREDVFKAYLKFLQTKNNAWLIQANRNTM